MVHDDALFEKWLNCTCWRLLHMDFVWILQPSVWFCNFSSISFSLLPLLLLLLLLSMTSVGDYTDMIIIQELEKWKYCYAYTCM